MLEFLPVSVWRRQYTLEFCLRWHCNKPESRCKWYLILKLHWTACHFANTVNTFYFIGIDKTHTFLCYFIYDLQAVLRQDLFIFSLTLCCLHGAKWNSALSRNLLSSIPFFWQCYESHFLCQTLVWLCIFASSFLSQHQERKQGGVSGEETGWTRGFGQTGIESLIWIPAQWLSGAGDLS